MSLYTKAGDKGKSVVRNKKTLDKSSLIFEVLGSLDELSCALGFLQLSKIPEIKNTTISVQEDLLIIGSVISNVKKSHFPNNYWGRKTGEMEKMMDKINRVLPKLDSFIMPGGSIESSYLHVARVTCRKTERVFVKYWKSSGRRNLADISMYINRLSDTLFVLARYSNKKSRVKEITWKSSKQA